MTKVTLSSEFIDESLADKARWFAALTFEQRLAWLDEWTAIILQNNPKYFERVDDDSSFQGTVYVLRKKQR
jgi:hypothetical protein